MPAHPVACARPQLPAVITMAVDLASHAFSQPSYTVIEAVNAGYNVVAICFLLVTGPADFAADWAAAGPAAQQAAVAYAHSMGAMVIVAAGGVTDVPYNMDATAYGKYVAQWVKDNNLDGIDFDLEGLGSGFTAGPIVGQVRIHPIARGIDVPAHARITSPPRRPSSIG